MGFLRISDNETTQSDTCPDNFFFVLRWKSNTLMGDNRHPPPPLPNVATRSSLRARQPA
ncbi:hypothetical protein OE88DRAFT_1650436 [Heliocybe sulcata]|uniref:Uncharacterized protein n=1 Tax=Heliocybe sulcata TaxID=5364 RepID=A0A5C3NG99_9AGAM|nr:hypothetical protein OE88DRAFT_1650436 [Heliocybe sulcata]